MVKILVHYCLIRHSNVIVYTHASSNLLFAYDFKETLGPNNPRIFGIDDAFIKGFAVLKFDFQVDDDDEEDVSSSTVLPNVLVLDSKGLFHKFSYNLKDSSGESVNYPKPIPIDDLSTLGVHPEVLVLKPKSSGPFLSSKAQPTNNEKYNCFPKKR